MRRETGKVPAESVTSFFFPEQYPAAKHYRRCDRSHIREISEIHFSLAVTRNARNTAKGSSVGFGAHHTSNEKNFRAGPRKGPEKSAREFLDRKADAGFPIKVS